MIKADMFQIKEEVTKNLLSAHKRIAEEGNAKEVIRLSRYLLKLEQKFGDVGTYAIPENQQQWCENPVHDLDDTHS